MSKICSSIVPSQSSSNSASASPSWAKKPKTALKQEKYDKAVTASLSESVSVLEPYICRVSWYTCDDEVIITASVRNELNARKIVPPGFHAAFYEEFDGWLDEAIQFDDKNKISDDLDLLLEDIDLVELNMTLQGLIVISDEELQRLGVKFS